MLFKRKRIEVYSITVDGIEIEVTRKRIKNLYVRVHRRSGQVRVSCPESISERGVIQFIKSKIHWIKKQKAIAKKQKHRTEPIFISGEEHFFEGNKYTLQIVEGAKKSLLFIEEGRLVMNIRGEVHLKKKKKLLDEWYRNELIINAQSLIKHYEPILNVKVKEFRVKKMKTRWGTCNIRDKRIWLNLELAKKSKKCLEMVVVHEMVHLLEPSHNKRFYSFMDVFMPDWKAADKELKSFID